MKAKYFQWQTVLMRQFKNHFVVFIIKKIQVEFLLQIKAGLHWQLWEATLVGDAIFRSESCSATQLLEIEKFLIWVALLSNSTAQKSCWHNKNLGSQQFSMNFISFYCYYFVLFHYFVSISFHFIIFVLFLCDSHKSKFKT
jgi:hypothetical protein